MDSKSRDKQKKRGITRFFNSFKYSVDGLKYAYQYEQSMTIHCFLTVLVIIFGFWFDITAIEWILCFLFIGLIMATELINTSLEAVVDLACPEKHPLAKIAKDTASAAVFVFSITALIGGFILFLPKIIEVVL